jgi:competence protein ComEA
MAKKSCFMLLKNHGLMSFTLMMCAVMVVGLWAAPAAAARKADAQKSIAAPVDLNSATQKELEDVKGVGPATAKKIIAGRPYKSVDELSKAGLKLKAIESIKPFVTVGKVQAAPAATAAVKTPVKAAAAASAAPESAKAAKEVKAASKPAAAAKLAPGTKININTADKTVEDVMKVKGVKGKTFDAIKDFIVVK